MKKIYEGTADEFAAYEKAKQSSQCTKCAETSKGKYQDEPKIEVSLDISGLDEAQVKADKLTEILKEIQTLMPTTIKRLFTF